MGVITDYEALTIRCNPLWCECHPRNICGRECNLLCGGNNSISQEIKCSLSKTFELGKIDFLKSHQTGYRKSLFQN